MYVYLSKTSFNILKNKYFVLKNKYFVFQYVKICFTNNKDILIYWKWLM